MIVRFALLLMVFLMCSETGHAQAAVASQDSSANFPSRWHFGVQGGLAQRLFRPGMIAPSEEKYIDDLKAGYSFGGKITYYIWPKVGLGIVADHFQGRATAPDGFREQVTIRHLSGSVNYRTLIGEKDRTSVISSFFTGYQPYRNQTTFTGQTFTLTGNTMGWGISVSLEHRISARMAIGLTGSAMMGAIYRIKRTTDFSTEILHLSKDDSVDLSRASITLGISFM